MLKSYRRRAFLLLALAALELSVAPAAHADDGPSLWDVLSKTETPILLHGPQGGTGVQVVRRSLGPVPGITLAGTDGGAQHKHSGVLGALGDWFNNLESKTGTKIKTTGNSTTTAQFTTVSGSAAAFASDQYLGQGGNGIYNSTDITVDATLFKWFHYQTRISNSLMKNPNDNRVLMDYKNGGTRVQYGDINVSFSGNSLIDFSRYLHGMEVEDTWSQRLKTTLLYAETKATTQTIVITGNNSAGPYYVYAGQIVDGSAQVRVNNQTLASGVDYTLDTYNGQLNFLKNRIILASDTIAVSFESLGVGGNQGAIYGGRAEVYPTRNWSFGVTMITQTAPNANPNQTETESFEGNGTPGPYTTNSPIDVSKPVVIMVGGLALLPSQYQISKQTLYTDIVYITIPIPQTTVFTIQWFPYNANPTAGSRNVVGLETKYIMGKLGTVTLETAMSGLSISNTNYNGLAASLRADLTPFKSLHTALTVKDINPTFSSIQTPGFSQNEKSIDLSTDYTPFSRLRLNLDAEIAHRPSYSGTSQFSIDTIGNDHFHQLSGGGTYTLSKNSTLGLTMSDITTNYAVGGFSTEQTEALTYTQTIKKVGIDFSINNTASNVASSSAVFGDTSTTANTLFTSTSSSYGGRFGLHWQANKALAFTGSLSLNKIKTDSGGAVSDNTAKDSQISATFAGIRGVHLTYSLDYSDTGSAAVNTLGSGSVTPVVATGTTGGSTTSSSKAAIGDSMFAALASMSRDSTGSGSTATSAAAAGSSGALAGGGINSNLGGFGNQNNVLNSSLGYTSFGGSSLSNRLQMDFTPRKSMQIGLSLSKSSSIGSYEYNSDSTSVGLSANWQLSDKLQFTGNYNIQQLNYTGGFGATSNNTAMLSVQGRPFGGKMGVQFGIQSMHTNSAFNTAATGTTSGASTGTSSLLTNTANDLTSITARLDYPINRKETLFVEMLDSITSGYLANEENDIRFGMDYALTKVLKFSFGWQILRHTYSDPADADLNYHASNLLAQFGFHF